MADMQKPGLLMTKEAFARVPELLQERGIVVEARLRIGEFAMLGCRRDGVTVLLSELPHSIETGDGRQELIIVAALGESVFRFWRLGRERRLRAEIIEVLRPHGWSPPGSEPAR